MKLLHLYISLCAAFNVVFCYSEQVQYDGVLNPRVTIISSLRNSDAFIEAFMYDITRQTIFNQCELVIINASPLGHEDSVVKRYMKVFPNIMYIKLQEDPGFFAVWNMGVKVARAAYITHANVSDRLAPQCYEKHAQALDEHADVGLVYSDCSMTTRSNETWEQNTGHALHFDEFTPNKMNVCLPNNHPMWRKSLHTTYGLFDENYATAGDYEMWLRVVAHGVTFLKIPAVLGVMHRGKAVSSRSYQTTYSQEVSELHHTYAYLWE
jgi:GT2 family glycosyltransferase